MTIKKFTEFGSVDQKDDVTDNSISKEELVEQAKLFNSFADNISTFNTNLKKAELFLELFESISKDIDSLVRKEDVGTILSSQLISFNSQLEEFKKSLQTANQEKISLLEDQLKTMASKAAIIWQELEEQTKDVKNTFFEKDIENQKRIDNLVKVFESLELDQVEITLSEFYKEVNQLKENVNNKLPEFDSKIQKFVIENSESIKNYINESNQLKDFVSGYVETIDKKFNELKNDNDLQNPKLESFEKQIKESLLGIKLLKDTLKESEKTNKSAIDKVVSNFEEVKTKFAETVLFINEETDKQKKRSVESDINLDSKLENVKEFISKLESKYQQLKENHDKSEKDILSLIEKSDSDIKDGFDQKILSTKEELKNTITESETKTKNFVDQYNDTLHKHISNVVKDFKTQIESTNKSLTEHSVFLLSVSNDVNNVFKSEKFTKLSRKIDFLEEALEKFNEKTILNEGLLPQPSEKTSDPLTPLNKNFVTFDDLKKHYQLFINRIQTQLSSLGGGGAVRLDQLDDVDYRIVNATDNQVLTYVSANSKWEAKTVSGGGGGTSVSDAEVVDGNLIITLSDTSTIDAGYVIGPQGADGNTGATGASGISAGLRFIYNSGSGFQDPGDGKFSVNRDSTPTFTSTTRLIFSYQSADAIAVNTLISTWDDNTTQTNRGVVMISKANGTQQSWWYITGTYAVAGNGLWNHTPATFLGGSTAFTNGDEYFVTFVRNGDKGNVGNVGANGISVTNATVNESGNLIITLSDSSNVDVGSVSPDLSSYALTTDLTTANVVELTNLYYSNARVTANVVDYLLNAPNALIGNVVVVDTLTTPNFEVSETLTIGSQIIYAQGTNGFSVNEDFDPSNSSTQTAYHYTSGAGRETVAFTLARTGQFTNGFGIYGTAADNKFVMFGEQSNTGFEWRRGVGIRPLDLDGGTLLANISPTGDLTVTGNIRASGFIGNISGLITDNVTEGSNLYFTNTRAVSALTAGQNINISSNGLITASVTGGGGVSLGLLIALT